MQSSSREFRLGIKYDAVGIIFLISGIISMQNIDMEYFEVLMLVHGDYRLTGIMIFFDLKTSGLSGIPEFLHSFTHFQSVLERYKMNSTFYSSFPYTGD